MLGTCQLMRNRARILIHPILVPKVHAPLPPKRIAKCKSHSFHCIAHHLTPQNRTSAYIKDMQHFAEAHDCYFKAKFEKLIKIILWFINYWYFMYITLLSLLSLLYYWLHVFHLMLYIMFSIQASQTLHWIRITGDLVKIHILVQ